MGGKGSRILESLGYEFKQQHVHSYISNADKARAVVQLEIPFDDVLEKYRRQLLVDWDSSDIDRNPRVFPEFVDGDRG